MNIRIYISKNTDLPNVNESFNYIQSYIAASDVGQHHLELIESTADKFEYPALDKCWQDSQELEFYGLYLHCKGASKTDQTELMNGLAWLHYMLYGLLTNSKTCITHLDKGADLVGCMWFRHFKGNCFWFKSSYVKNLIRPAFLDTANRYVAEYWCSQAYWFNSFVAFPKVKNLFYAPTCNDAEFLALRAGGYVPEIPSVTICSDLSGCIERSEYSVFDELIVTKEEYDKYTDVLLKYINYDAKITIKE